MSKLGEGLSELGVGAPRVNVKTELVEVSSTGRAVQFSVEEGPGLMIIGSTIPGGPKRAVTMPDGTVYWEDKNPVEFQREYVKMGSDD